MPPATHRVRATTLAWAEIRALPRQTFALGAVAVLLAGLAPLAAFSLYGPSATGDYLLFLWVIGELAVAIVLAARIASARRTRFVESLYTTPLEARTWLAAQALVGLFLAGLVVLAQVPFVLVHVALIGMPPALPAILVATAGMALFAVAFGLFCGVVVGESGPGAAAGLAGGVAFLSFLGLIVHGISAVGPPTPAQVVLLRLTTLSPLSLVVDATGIGIFDAAVASPWRPALGFAALVAGLGGAAWVAYVRGQGPLGWEPGRARGAVVALVALAVVVPVATAADEFREVEDDPSFVLQHGEQTRIAFVPRGAPITDEPFSLYGYFEWESLVHGQDNELDALVMLVVPPGESVRGVTVHVRGSDELAVVDGGRLAVADGAPHGSARVGESFDDDVEPTGPVRPVYRVPVTLRPVEAKALMGSPGLVEVATTFTMDGRAHESLARVTLDAEIPGASTALLLAGAPLPIAAAGALAMRRVRTR